MFSNFATAPHVSKENKRDVRRKQKKNASNKVGESEVLGTVQEAVSVILGGEVGANEPLMSAGLDSLSAVEFRNDLESKFGIELPGTLVFDYPTSSSIAAFISTLTSCEEVETQSEISMDSVYDKLVKTAECGMVISNANIRSSDNALAFVEAKDASDIIPMSRWDIESHSHLFSGLPARFAPTLGEIEMFDPLCLSISDGEAALMDPQQGCSWRWLLKFCFGSHSKLVPMKGRQAYLLAYLLQITQRSW